MDIINIICILAIIITSALAIGISIYKLCKLEGGEFDLKYFVDEYGDVIIDIMKDVIKVIKISDSSMSEFQTKEEYEKAIIELTIEEIKQNYDELGIDISILSLIDTEKLAGLICDILHKNAINIFSVLDILDIKDNERLYDEDVVLVLTSADEKK